MISNNVCRVSGLSLGWLVVCGVLGFQPAIFAAVSEGLVAHAIDSLVADENVTGSGVHACVLADGVDALTAVQNQGELPAVTVLPGQAGAPSSSEGTALLEIIHDIAPGAELSFATMNGGTAQAAQNILDLAAIGCDVMVVTPMYATEPVYQDGLVSQAIATVFADQVLVFAAAGNNGRLNAGTSGTWEGQYQGMVLPPPLVGAGLSAHDFGGGNNSIEITQDSLVGMALRWADPIGASDNDYDLYVLDATQTNVVLAATNTQSGSQDPLEFLPSIGSDYTGLHLVVVKFSGLDRTFHLSMVQGQLADGTAAAIVGGASAADAITVSAANHSSAAGGVFTGGAANPVEFFSSDGPRSIHFMPDGTPLGSPEQRQKPELVAADGVTTTTPSYTTYFGSNPGAAHAAGMAVLFKELIKRSVPNGLSVAQARSRLLQSALDIEAPGVDRDSGQGILMADKMADQVPIFAGNFEAFDPSLWSNR